MRELKFRAWDGEQMVSPEYIDRRGIAHWKENSIPTTSDKVMQYTGLKDKNGKEIYEGDINQDKGLMIWWVCSYWWEYPNGDRHEVDGSENKWATVIGNIFETP